MAYNIRIKHSDEKGNNIQEVEIVKDFLQKPKKKMFPSLSRSTRIIIILSIPFFIFTFYNITFKFLGRFSIPSLLNFSYLFSPSPSSSSNSQPNLSTSNNYSIASFNIPSTNNVKQEEPNECIVMTHDNSYVSKRYQPFNSRMFCRSSTPICLSSDTLYGFSTPTFKKNLQCRLSTASLHHSVKSSRFKIKDCSEVHDRVRCVHGKFPNPNEPECPSKEGPIPTTGAKWLDGKAVIIPAYPHLSNIYHFSFVAVTAVNLGRDLIEQSRDNSDRKLIFIFRGRSPYELGRWQTWIFDSLRKRLEYEEISSSVHSFGLHHAPVGVNIKEYIPVKNETLCVNSGLLMGPRGTVNVWPFPTSHAQKHRETKPKKNMKINANRLISRLKKDDRFHIPAESLRFRTAVYESANISTSELNIPPSTPLSKRIWTNLPPPTLSYSRRNTQPDPLPGQPTHGPIRRFSDSDEKFLNDSLASVCRRYNLTFQTLQPKYETPMSAQVLSFYDTGILIGIHGANLMNSLFMTPLSALIEVSTFLPCYVSGANSGLVSWAVRPDRVATPEESNCVGHSRYARCMESKVERRILLDGKKVRIQLQNSLEEAAVYITEIRRRFSVIGKVPLVLDERTASYSVDWD